MKHIYPSILLSMMAVGLPATALDASHFAQRSKLSEGRWVRVKVEQSGMQAISFEQLRQWGFDEPQKVAVYGYGGVRMVADQTFSSDTPDDLQQTATMVDNERERLIFYGEATTRLSALNSTAIEYYHNVYDTCGHYFLSDCESRSEVTTSDYPAAADTEEVSRHLSARVYQPDDHNNAHGSAFWLGPELSASAEISVSFDIDAYDHSCAEPGSLGYIYAACNDKSATNLQVTLPDNVSISSLSSRPAVKRTSTTNLFNIGSGTARFSPANGVNELTMTSGYRIGTSGGNVTYAALKQVWAVYPRHNTIGADGSMTMTLPAATAGSVLKICGPNKAELWNIGDPTQVYRYQTRYSEADGATYAIIDKDYDNDGKPARMIAFYADAELQTPQYDSDVPNQNIHGDETPDMVIISTDELRPLAEDLAKIHRERGSKVNVYTHHEVLNEFGSGTAAPMAYRMMAKMFYERDRSTFRHLLLYGPTTWDFRGIVEPSKPCLLTMLAEREAHYKEDSANFSSDSYFGMLSDDYSGARIEYTPQHIGVGRLNISNPALGANVNKKIAQYLDNPLDPATYARAMVISCIGDLNAHYNQAETLAEKLIQCNGAVTVTRAHNSLFPLNRPKAKLSTQKVLESLNQGLGFMNYSGHGSEYMLGTGSDIVWDKGYTNQLSNSSYPLMILSTCSAYSLDRGNDDVSSAMVLKADGGAIACIGACRKVFLAYNGIFTQAVGQAYAEATPGMTIGDMYVRARNLAITNSAGSKGALANNLCFNLCGDPLVKLPVPDHGIEVSSIAGQSPSDEKMTEVAPHNGLSIKGYITDTTGQRANDFNGSLRAIIYESPRVQAQVVKPEEGNPANVVLEEEILAEAAATVKNGEFEIELCLPEPSHYGSRNRIVFSAVTDSGGGEYHGALGYSEALVLSPDAAATNPIEGKAANISKIYIDSPDFVNGGEIEAGSDHCFHAIVEAEGTGIANTAALVGAKPRLSLDGNNELGGIESSYSIDSEGNYNFCMPLPGELTTGRHSLKFSLVNTLGEYSSRGIDFNIVPRSYDVRISIAEEPATTEATIDIATEADMQRNRLLITDLQGNTVYSAADVSFPYCWHLTDMQGKPVADGPYQVNVLVLDEAGYGHSTPCRVVVVKP